MITFSSRECWPLTSMEKISLHDITGARVRVFIQYRDVLLCYVGKCPATCYHHNPRQSDNATVPRYSRSQRRQPLNTFSIEIQNY